MCNAVPRVLLSYTGVSYTGGKESKSQLGAVGVGVEVGVIVYLMCASLVGVYSVPQLRWLVPTPHDTPMTKVSNFFCDTCDLPTVKYIIFTVGIWEFYTTHFSVYALDIRIGRGVYVIVIIYT